ncbi:Flagellin [Syntrophomonas zehnderi OL-4]|uniref:Flagellin n=1 Tax=Syntrophomonas zehnderi OL-4 TaxID=690567 RepID=A0A0E3W2P5_9FIRM|nr:flagellin [Syntrophomonas zehnderi]CFX12595.1 Flagellin [Syntrophomonas zehnderi OL-4]
MIINHNLMAMNTQRQLGINNLAGAKATEKLSSGFRINRAGDDAAGLAISEKMRGQIRGLNMASKNAQDGISLIQTAEGALNETHAILQRMRELAVQSASDTNVVVDRSELQKEVDQLAKEVSRIGQTTQFNTQHLLTGDFKEKVFHIGANEGQNLKLTIADMRAYELAVVGSTKIELEATVSGTGTAKDGIYTINGTDLIDANGHTVATTADAGLTWVGAGELADVTFTFEQKVDTGTIKVLDGKATGISEFSRKTESTLEAGDYKIDSAKGQLLDGAGNIIATSTDNITFTSTKAGVGTVLKLDAAATKDYTVSVGGVDISSQSTANKSITTINNAIETVSAERSKLGALQNRLEHTIKNLDTSAENLQAAESRIRDVDMAKEIMEFTKQNILQQAATAMLAQANQAPQSVLQLLR